VRRYPHLPGDQGQATLDLRAQWPVWPSIRHMMVGRDATEDSPRFVSIGRLGTTDGATTITALGMWDFLKPP